jgi:hypothetical protein
MATLTDAQIAGVLRSAGFPANQIATGVAIALAESGGRTDAVNTANRNGTWDAGLMQVNSIHGYTQSYLFDPGNNARASLKIFQAAGNRWTPWSTYNNGSYRRYIARGTAAAGAAPDAAAPPAGSPPSTGDAPSNESLDRLSSGGLWLRLGAYLGGVILLALGAIGIITSSKTVRGMAVEAAKIAVTKGK